MAASMTKQIAVAFLKLIGVFIFIPLVFILSFTAFFFLTPKIEFSSTQLRWVLEHALPKSVQDSVQIDFQDLHLTITRPAGLTYAKAIAIDAKDFCVRYQIEAVHSCFKDIHLGLTYGWLSRISSVKPGIISIDPIRLVGGDASVDLRWFPVGEKKPKTKPSFNWIEFLRAEVLPKWNLENSLVEVQPFKIRIDDAKGYDANIVLDTSEKLRQHASFQHIGILSLEFHVDKLSRPLL